MGVRPVTKPSKPRELIQAVALMDVPYIKRQGREGQVLRTLSRLRDHWWRQGHDCECTPHLMKLKLKDLEEVAATCISYAGTYEKTN